MPNLIRKPVVFLVAIGAFLVSCAAKEPQKEPSAKERDAKPSAKEPDVQPGVKDDAVDFEQMIDDLASRNAAPEFISLRPTYAPKIEPPLFGEQPFFPKDYDWDDQSRVLKATKRLFECDDPELWEHLIRHVGDRRYAMTRGNIPSYSQNYTVGDMCRRAAWSRLEFARKHSNPPDGTGRSRLVYVDVGIHDLEKWRKENPDKSLYDLQVEFCERALRAIPTEEELTDEAHARATQKVRRYLDQLKETRKPLFFTASIPGHPYRARSGQALRDSYEKQQAEEKSKKHDEEKSKKDDDQGTPQP